jgi:hypothetical protein
MTTSRKEKPGKLDISPDLNKRFRALVVRRYSVKKGMFKMAAEEAVTERCEKVEKQIND